MVDFKSVELRRKDAPDVVFDGKLIAQNESDGVRTRWTELSIYELRSGYWLAVSNARSAKEDEYDFADIKLIDDAVRTSFRNVANSADNADPRAIDQIAAMDFFKWSWLAKELAEDAGWDVRERIA